MKLIKTFSECLSVLSKKDKRKYWAVVVAQAILGFLDLFGVAVMGVIGALAIRGVQSQPNSGEVTGFLELLRLNGFAFQTQVAILGGIAAVVLVFRTLASMFFTWKILHFLSRRSAQISSELLSRILKSGYLRISKFNHAELQFTLGPGVSSVVVGVLGTGSTVLGDAFSLAIVTAGILLIDPLIAVAAILLFSGVGIYLYFSLHNYSEKIGRGLTEESIKSNKLISEILGGYREIYVINQLQNFISRVSSGKFLIADLYARNTFIPNISKYAIEVALVIGASLVAAAQFVLNDATHAFASLAVFVAAGSRIAPALLRIQQGAIGIKSNLGMSHSTLEALRSFPELKLQDSLPEKSLDSDSKFKPDVFFKDVTFGYGRGKRLTLNIPKLEIAPGSINAIVGPSGAGKSTLIDVMLGILEPQSGSVTISGTPPSSAIQKWPGAIAYVPQNAWINEASIAENIALGVPKKEIIRARVLEVLDSAMLLELVESLPDNIDTLIGERGVGLSGGQLQRLGIARALYLNPKLIVFDEATSALDGVTENEISKAFSSMRESATVIIIAHRLSTIQGVDKLIYLEDGEVKASGTFDEVRKAVPEFHKQAGLMGL